MRLKCARLLSFEQNCLNHGHSGPFSANCVRTFLLGQGRNATSFSSNQPHGGAITGRFMFLSITLSKFVCALPISIKSFTLNKQTPPSSPCSHIYIIIPFPQTASTTELHFPPRNNTTLCCSTVHMLDRSPHTIPWRRPVLGRALHLVDHLFSHHLYVESSRTNIVGSPLQI